MDVTRQLLRLLPHTPAAALAAGVSLGVQSPAFGQREPVARMLPARPVDPVTTVSRAATPDDRPPVYQVPSSVPAPTYGGRPQRSVPTPKPEPGDRPVGAFSGIKTLFGGKSAEPKAEVQKPWWPTTDEYPRPNTPAAVKPVQAVVSQLPVTPPAPGVYAGPPAYRWYGYGSPTPGMNPYSPNGLYPKGSANWYSQIGATPGAFPVPVTHPPRPDGTEPPAYAGVTLPADGVPLTVSRRYPDETAAQPDPAAYRRVVASAGSKLWPTGEPQVPTGSGTPVASSAPYTEPAYQDLSWQPVSTRSQAPIAATPPPAAGATIPPPTPGEPSWEPALRTQPGGSPSPAAPSVSLIRGQAPADEPVDEPALVRNACFGRATAVGVTKIGRNKLHVTLVVPTVTDGRDAAAAVSRVPELKAYAITFEASVGR